MKRSGRVQKPNSPSKLILEEVIGLTTKNANGLTSSISNSKCAYIAGCVVVLYDVESCTQSHLMAPNRKLKPLSSVALSRDGSLLAAGELGKQPAVLIWDSATKDFVCELKSHQFGVACIAFSPDGKYLASVGFLNDGYMCLWDLRSQILLTKTKACSLCSAITSISFTLDAKFIVTSGKKHLKFWKFANSTRSRASIRSSSWLMQGKPVTLRQYKGCSFITVSSSNMTESIYAVTDSGILCLLDSSLSITNSIDLQVEKCFALSISKTLVACACNNGVIKLCAFNSLKHLGSLYYSEGNKYQNSKTEDHNANIIKEDLPNAIACQFSTLTKLVVIYDDHSLYIWDIQDPCEATRCCVLVSHKSSIWDIKNLFCENMHDPSISCVVKGCSGGVSFTTCSADGTIRLWDFVNETCGTRSLVSAGIFERDSVASDISSPGFKSMTISSDGKYLASGDCLGNLHIFNLHTSEYRCIQNVHHNEIISLSFSPTSNNFLATGGKNGIIHLYDVERDFKLIGTQNDHSASVTSIKLTCNGSKLLSSSIDGLLVFRDVAVKNPEHKISCRGSIYDMAVDHLTNGAVTVGQDKKINTYSISSGKLIRSFKHDNLGDPIKVNIDPSYSYLVCSYSSKCICVYDYITGEMVAQATGHSDVITGVIFLSDCKHLVSVDGDGCIFVWKLPDHLSSIMLKKTLQHSSSLPTNNITTLKYDKVNDSSWLSSKADTQILTSQLASEFQFSVSRLPKWAQSKVCSPGSQYINQGLEHTSNSGNSNTNSSQESPTPHKTFSATLDNRWLTIHTVFFDQLSSPGMWQMNDLKHMSEEKLKGRSSKNKNKRAKVLSPMESYSTQVVVKRNWKPLYKAVPLNGVEEMDLFKASKEALDDLESAADKAYNLFSRFANMDSTEGEGEFYTEAAGKISCIQKKIDAVAKLAKLTNTSLY